MIDNREVAKVKDIVRRRKALLIIPFVTMLAVSAVVAFLLPGIFRSSGIILIQYPQIPPNLVPSTVTSYADQRIQAITQEVTARSRILSLVQKHDLLPNRRERLTAEELVEEIRDRIILEPIDAQIKKETENRPVPLTIAFRLSYEDEDPKKAQLITNEIASYFLKKSHETREKHAKSTTRFLEDQLRGAKNKLDELETKLATFREAHLEELPEFSVLNLQKVEKLSSEISNLNMQNRALEEQRSTVKNKLASTDPHTSSNEKVISPEERLQQAQLERASLASRYSEQHPAIQAKNQEIGILEQSTREGGKLAQARERLQKVELKLAALRSRYTDEHPDIKSTQREIDGVKKEIESLQTKGVQPRSPKVKEASNPNYVSLKTELDRIEVSLNSIREEKVNLEKHIDKVYAKLHSMPQVGKEYNELTTDYQNAKTHYTELQQKAMAAQVGQGMEEEQLGETFQIMDPPFLPEKPVRPNRPAIILIAAILGVGLSVGGTSMREYTDDSVRDVKTLMELTGIPVFTVIPRIVTDEDKSGVRKRRMLLVTGILCTLLLMVSLFHFFVMDLYVVYAKAIRVLAKYVPI